MSKIALSPDAAGTGTFTLASPNGNTNRTITLPDGDVTLGAATPSITDNGNATAITIDANENVGIGTSSPSDKLHVDGSGAFIRVNRTDGEAGITLMYNGSNSTRSNIATQTNGDLNFKTANTERMRINSSGDLLVGKTVTSSNTAGIRMVGSAAPGYVEITRSGGNPLYLNRQVSTGEMVRFDKDGVQKGGISVTGSSTSFNTSSDYRLKTDAQPMTGASARVQALNPVNFEWIADGSRVDGFLAHEAQAVVPEAVHGTKDAMRDEEYEVTPAVLDDDGNETTAAVMGTRSVPDYQGIDQSKLVPLLTAALQEALTKIDDMETRLAALENN